MRVLDVGSGAGDTAFLATDLVGKTGEVIGTDRALDAIKTAQRLAEAQALHNVSFRHGDPTEMAFERPFDAVVGRYVLIFNRNAASMLRRLAKQLKPGGLIVFHHPGMGIGQSSPRAELYDRCCHWAIEGFRLGGTQIDTAYKMHSIFVAADLPAPTVRIQVSIGARHTVSHSNARTIEIRGDANGSQPRAGRWPARRQCQERGDTARQTPAARNCRRLIALEICAAVY